MNGTLPSSFMSRSWRGTVTETGPKGGTSTFDVTCTFLNHGMVGDNVAVLQMGLTGGNNGCKNATYDLQLTAILAPNHIETRSIRKSANGNCNPGEIKLQILPSGQLKICWWVAKGNIKQERTGCGIL